jgi:hypothetical protein
MAGTPLAEAIIRLKPDVDKSEFKKEGAKAGEAAGSAAGESFADGFYRDSAGKLRQANGRFATDAQKAMIEGGGKAGSGFAGSFSSAASKKLLGGGSGTSVFSSVAKVVASRFALIGGAAVAATPPLLNLTAALLPATGALVALPAAFAAIKVASATVKVAVGETGDAIKKGLTGTAKEAEKALKELTPAQRDFARTIIALKPQIEGLKEAVSERFFRPFVDDIRPLAERYFPLIRKQMADLAGPIGGLAEQFAETASKAQVMQAVPRLFDGTSNAVVRLRGAIDPLVQALAATISATAGKLPGLAQSIANVATKFNGFVQRSAQSGAIGRVFEEGKRTIIEFSGVVRNVASILSTVFRAATANSQGLLTNLREITGQAAAFLKTGQGFGALTAIFGVLAQLGAAFQVALAGVLPAVADAFQQLGPAVGAAALPMAELLVALTPLVPLVAGLATQVLVRLTPAIAALASFLSENATLVKAAAFAFIGLSVALKASSALIAVQAAGGLVSYLKTIKLVTVATKIWTGVQIAFNAVAALNPYVAAAIAIAALVAGIVIAYKRSEKFRAVVQAVWGAIKTAISATVTWITGTAWPALKAAWDGIAAGAMWLWRNVIQPVWNGIKAVIGVVITIVRGYIKLLVAEFRLISAAAMWLWRNVFVPVFAGIRKIVEIWWFAMRVAFAAFVKVIRALVMPVLRSAQSLFGTVFRIIRAAVSAWWADMKRLFGLFRQYVIGPLMNAIRVARDGFRFVFTTISNIIRNWWTGTVQPIFANVRRGWQALSSAFSSVYNGRIKPLFNQFISFMRDKVAKAFSTAVNIIRVAWAKVQEAARKPVAFVVNRVINPFIGGLNKAASIVGIKDRIDPIAGFARGGQIPGRPSNRDNMLASITGSGRPLKVASGEFITNTRSTLANLPLIKAINAKRGKVSREDVDPYLDGASSGGRVGRGGVGDGLGDLFGKITNGLKGIGSAILNPGAAIKKVAGGLLDKIPGGGMLRDFVKGAASRTINAAAKWLTDFGGAGVGGGNGPEGWKAKRAIIASWFPGLRMISGPRPGARTLNGNRSLHADGLAVDYPPVRALALRIRSLFGKSTQELITPWNDLNLLRGRPHRYTGAVWNQHNFPGGNAHVHWGAALGGLVDRFRSGMRDVPVFDKGGILAPGLNLIRNKLRRPEPLMRALPTDIRPIRETSDPRTVAEEMLRRALVAAGKPLRDDVGGGGGGGSYGSGGSDTVRLHPSDMDTLARLIGREVIAVVGAGNYAAGRRAALFARGA